MIREATLILAFSTAIMVAGCSAFGSTATPSSLECAAYYYNTQAPFLIAPGAKAEMFGPHFNWAYGQLTAALEEDAEGAKAATAAVQEKMRGIFAANRGAGSGGSGDLTYLEKIVEIYDVPCQRVTGFPPVDLRAGIARAGG